jgi:ABC-2 type transport system permease protein
MGYITAGITRAFFLAFLITALGVVLVHTWPIQWGIYFLTIVLVGVLFSSLGIIFGLLAEKFDHIALLTTFFITPLVFVGGVFTSTQFMPPALRTISMFNPVFYMINAFRYSYTGTGDAPLMTSLLIVFILAAAAFLTALRMLAVGYKLRT